MSFLKYNLASFVWALLILWLSLRSSSGLPIIDIPHFDKLIHFAFYLVLAMLMFYGWKKHVFNALHRHAFIGIVIIATAYGVVIELMQESLTSNRHFEALDIVADSIGAIIGSLISVKLFK
jgi:VanZ family protein